jgi:sporulation protein YlmC with PRC-barrel domain
MLKVKNISEVLGKKVYTSDGDFFGQVEEVSLVDNRIEGWKIRIGSGFASALGGARGVVIPHQFVKAIGDVLVITKTMLPAAREESPAVALEETGSLEAEEEVI